MDQIFVFIIVLTILVYLYVQTDWAISSSIENFIGRQGGRCNPQICDEINNSSTHSMAKMRKCMECYECGYCVNGQSGTCISGSPEGPYNATCEKWYHNDSSSVNKYWL